ncbi:MAG: methyltransferase domain-containing protein [Cohaesibacteraceae bacterium]|nr:methyltransferase domain-containing protein [Cohaesibacteraceae bacterium]MBL4875901.1 methyltransferase domain-containing protein [Cohaesibacteraceae bacterium]
MSGRLNKAVNDVRFIKNWITKPLTTGAVAPSSPSLARAMARFVDPDSTGPVIELGPGTGVVTDALLNHNIAPSRITSVEYNCDFCKILHKRFPNINIQQGDAYAFDQLMEGRSDAPLSAVVSSLPLFNRHQQQRIGLIREALSWLEPGAPFIQFSYALVPPVAAKSGEFSLSKTPWIMKNLPPARVWVYRREI